MVFTNQGIKEIRDWLRGASATAPTHIVCGSGTTSTDKTDTTLETEEHRETINSTTYGTDWVSFSILLDTTQENDVDLTEFGLINASTSGDLFQRAIHTVISKHSQLEVEYEMRLRLIN